MSFAENARLIERTLKQEDETEPIDAVDCVNAAIEYVPDGERDVDISVTTHPSGESEQFVSAVDKELLRRAIGELIENAVIHGTGEVEVEVAANGKWIDVRVRDEGPGIPGGEVEAIQAPVETALDHGSGLGLWVARWAADLCGGNLEFDERDGANVVAIRLPVAHP